MDQEKMKVEYINVDKLKPYERNARKHTDDDVQYIENSIREFGFNDPIGIWGEQNIIVEGHGRLLAAQNLGMKEVPCIRLDYLTDEQRRAYALAHNRTAELSKWDEVLKKTEIEFITDIDMTKFGFDGLLDDDKNPYTDKIKVPQYDVKGDVVSILDLYDRTKADELIMQIDDSSVDEGIKNFLKLAAIRHVVFDYRNIAEFYAGADEDVQRLMEKSALVIIDYNDAIANGFVRLTKRMKECMGDEG